MGQNQISNWIDQAKGVAGVALFVLSGVLAYAGLRFFLFDIEASYQGWGHMFTTEVILPSSLELAWWLTRIPSFLQAVWILGKSTGHELADHPMMNFGYVFFLFVDTALDIYGMSHGTMASYGWSAIATIFGFTICSEPFMVFFGSIFIGTGIKYVKDFARGDYTFGAGTRSRKSSNRHRPDQWQRPAHKQSGSKRKSRPRPQPHTGHTTKRNRGQNYQGPQRAPGQRSKPGRAEDWMEELLHGPK